MNATAWGMAGGLALGFAGAFGGIVAFIIVLVCGAAGLGVGRWLDGHLDLAAITGRERDRDRSRR